MKEDYLWNKTGENAEIERLENALRAFRYQEIEPPALPAKIIPFETKKPRGIFRLAFAFAACAAVVLIITGVWLKFPINKIEVAQESSETVAPRAVEKNSSDDSTAKRIDFAVEKSETPKQSIERNVVKARYRAVKANNRRINHLTARIVQPKQETIKLTREEKYAYGQLMLALSITSSNLKLVKDKINGIEEKRAVLENGR